MQKVMIFREKNKLFFTFLASVCIRRIADPTLKKKWEQIRFYERTESEYDKNTVGSNSRSIIPLQFIAIELSKIFFDQTYFDIL